MTGLSPSMGDLMQREHPKIRVECGWVGSTKTCNISETVQDSLDRTQVTITD